MAHRLKERAFTLIELLVVMSIIALLIAIFVAKIPAILNYYRVSVSKSVVQQVCMGVDNYAQVYDGAYPFDLAKMNASKTALLNGDTDGTGSDACTYLSAQGPTSVHLMLQGPNGQGWSASSTYPKVRSFGPAFASPGFSHLISSGKSCFVDGFGRPILYYRAKLDSANDYVTDSYDGRKDRYCQLNNRDAWVQRGANDPPVGGSGAMSDPGSTAIFQHWKKRITISKNGMTCYPANPKTYIVWAAGGDERFGYWKWSEEHGGYICDPKVDDEGTQDGIIATSDDILSCDSN
jgi:prepilin-type N-terminal cleavage/methylation domain-containing protein